MSACPACQKPSPEGARFCPSCGAAINEALAFGDYQVIEVLGEGGMGRVYKAMQPRLKRLVCVKTLLPDYSRDEAILERFEREATLTASLQHPNIVSVFDVGRTADGTAYLVMELVDGRTLRQVMRDEAPLPVDRALNLIDQVLAGLAEAHSHGIIHRDLKPGNVLVVALRDGTELCKVVDFGIARSVLEDPGDGGRLTRTGAVLGTPSYAAPEQVGGQPHDHRADLYAAGVILYELLTGQRPFRAASDQDLMRKKMLEAPPPPSTRTAEPIPLQVDQIVLRALATDPKDRFASANEYREALARVSRTNLSSGALTGDLSVEYTPLASAELTQPAANARALVASVIAATEEWDLHRLLDRFEQALRNLIASADVEQVRVLMRQLREAHADTPHAVGLNRLTETTRGVIVESLPLLVGWLEDPLRQPLASALMRGLGRGGIAPMLAQVAGTAEENRGRLLEVIRAMDPDGATLNAQLRAVPTPTAELLLRTALTWPDAEGARLLHAGLTAPDPTLRAATLNLLDERWAFRLLATLRQRLHDPHPPVRAAAMKWIFRIADEQSVTALAALLKRPTTSAAERRTIWNTLGAICTPEAVAVLVSVLETTPELEGVVDVPGILARTGTEAAQQALMRMSSAPAASKALRTAAQEALKDLLLRTPSRGIGLRPDVH